MENANDFVTMIIIAIMTAAIVPLLGRGMKFVYYMINLLAKVSIAATISAVIYGLLRDNTYMKGVSSFLESGMSMFGIPAGEGVAAEVQEKARYTAKSVLKEGIIRVMNVL